MSCAQRAGFKPRICKSRHNFFARNRLVPAYIYLPHKKIEEQHHRRRKNCPGCKTDFISVPFQRKINPVLLFNTHFKPKPSGNFAKASVFRCLNRSAHCISAFPRKADAQAVFHRFGKQFFAKNSLCTKVDTTRNFSNCS